MVWQFESLRPQVIAENAKKGDLPGGQSAQASLRDLLDLVGEEQSCSIVQGEGTKQTAPAQFLSMLESLFEKEAKRMEIDMKVGTGSDHWAEASVCSVVKI